MLQILKVRTDEIDGGGPAGPEFLVHYVLIEDEDDDGLRCFDLYTDDGRGNGDHVARGYNLNAMRHMALRLGEFVEWEAGGAEKLVHQKIAAALHDPR